MSTIILWGPARSRQRDESACAACLQVYLGQLARRQTLPTALRLPLGAAQSPCVPPLNNARRTVDTPRNTACGCLAAASELLCVFLCCCCCFFFAFHLRPQRCTARLLFVFFSLFTSPSLSRGDLRARFYSLAAFIYFGFEFGCTRTRACVCLLGIRYIA